MNITLYYLKYSKLNMVIISLIQSGGETRLDEATATPLVWKVPTGARNRTIRGIGFVLSSPLVADLFY